MNVRHLIPIFILSCNFIILGTHNAFSQDLPGFTIAIETINSTPTLVLTPKIDISKGDIEIEAKKEVVAERTFGNLFAANSLMIPLPFSSKTHFKLRYNIVTREGANHSISFPMFINEKEATRTEETIKKHTDEQGITHVITKSPQVEDSIIPDYQTIDLDNGQLVVSFEKPLHSISLQGFDPDGQQIINQTIKEPLQGRHQITYKKNLNISQFTIEGIDEEGQRHKKNISPQWYAVTVDELNDAEREKFSDKFASIAARAIVNKINLALKRLPKDAPPFQLYIVRTGHAIDTAEYEVTQFVKALSRASLPIPINFVATLANKDNLPSQTTDTSELLTSETIVILGTSRPPKNTNIPQYGWREIQPLR